MADWGPVFVGVVLFILLQPGLLFQFPIAHCGIQLGGMETSKKSILVHTLLFTFLYAILIMFVKLHVTAG